MATLGSSDRAARRATGAILGRPMVDGSVPETTNVRSRGLARKWFPGERSGTRRVRYGSKPVPASVRRRQDPVRDRGRPAPGRPGRSRPGVASSPDRPTRFARVGERIDKDLIDELPPPVPARIGAAGTGADHFRRHRESYDQPRQSDLVNRNPRASANAQDRQTPHRALPGWGSVELASSGWAS
jgi:hypothetical protein